MGQRERIARTIRRTADSFEVMRKLVDVPSEVWTRGQDPLLVYRGKPSECLAFIDLLCAEAVMDELASHEEHHP